MALNFFLSLRTGPMVVSWNTACCCLAVSSYVQCQCLAVAVQDRRISREVTKLQPAACQGFSPPPPPPSRAQLAQQSFINQIPINFFIAAFRFRKNNWLTSFQRAEIYSVTRQKRAVLWPMSVTASSLFQALEDVASVSAARGGRGGRVKVEPGRDGLGGQGRAHR